MTIDWQPLSTWPPKKRSPGEEFIFWQPAISTSGGRIQLPARATVSNGFPSGNRETSAWARIDPPPSAEDAARARLLAALALLEGHFYVDHYLPGRSELRAAILTALEGRKVPKSKATLTATREALYAAVWVLPGSGTANARENAFAEKASTLVRAYGGPR